jgi:hypothetical protein
MAPARTGTNAGKRRTTWIPTMGAGSEVMNRDGSVEHSEQRVEAAAWRTGGVWVIVLGSHPTRTTYTLQTLVFLKPIECDSEAMPTQTSNADPSLRSFLWKMAGAMSMMPIIWIQVQTMTARSISAEAWMVVTTGTTDPMVTRVTVTVWMVRTMRTWRVIECWNRIRRTRGG